MEDDDIMQEFLVEAGEILEQLAAQLIELERGGGDRDLLNAIFRGFHTVKGGAGFLDLQPMVEVCHRAEDVFNALRQNQRQVDGELTDCVLQALDAINTMFEAVRSGDAPSAPAPTLLRALDGLLDTPVGSPPPAAGGSASCEPPHDTISEPEFERLLDVMHGPGRHRGVPAEPEVAAARDKPTDEMSETEFEALLDQLHGQNTAPGQRGEASVGPPSPSDNQPVEPKPAATRYRDTGIRVDTRRLDEIMNLVGELVLVRNRLSTLKAEIDDNRMAKAVFDLDTVTAGLQEAAMQTRMQPVRKVFGRFPRVVRDLARALGKQVILEMRGEDTDLDKTLVDALAEPLVHLVRNAVDHGIESPAERRAAGKPAQGRVVLSAEQAGDHILLTIADDGGGMDPAALRQRAIERGVLASDNGERLSDREAFDLIFEPGFSTREEVTDVSGRGVGMDVVKTNIARLNGSIDIDAEPGRGSRIRIRVPLTLAILPALMVAVRGRRFAMPLACVGEIINFESGLVRSVEGRDVVLVRNRPLPLFYLDRWLADANTASPPDPTGQIILLQAANQQMAFVVDAVFGQEEVVIKPLGAGLHGLPGFAGATVTGDGDIALILDAASLVSTRTARAA